MIIRDNILLFLLKNICCDPSSEPSQRDGSDEGSQRMVLMRNKKNYHQILLLIWTSGLAWHVAYFHFAFSHDAYFCW